VRLHALHAHVARAVSAAEHAILRLHAVAQDAGATCLARGRELVNGALETVEGVRTTLERHLEAAFIIISTRVAASHEFSSLSAAMLRRS
jgi:hypothetical protein